MAGKHRRPSRLARLRYRRRTLLAPAAVAAAVLAVPASTPLMAAVPQTASAAGGAVVMQAVMKPTAVLAASAYRIRSGDTLSGIATRLCGSAADYSGLAAANGISDPDLILAGRTLWHISCSTNGPRSRPRVTYAGQGSGTAQSARRTYASTASRTSYPSRGGVNWDAIAQCESSGNWSTNTGNGFHGGLQFTQSTWNAYGGQQYAGSAENASRSAQIAVAQRVLAGQGRGAWPVCGSRG